MESLLRRFGSLSPLCGTRSSLILCPLVEDSHELHTTNPTELRIIPELGQLGVNGGVVSPTTVPLVVAASSSPTVVASILKQWLWLQVSQHLEVALIEGSPLQVFSTALVDASMPLGDDGDSVTISYSGSVSISDRGVVAVVHNELALVDFHFQDGSSPFTVVHHGRKGRGHRTKILRRSTWFGN
ncbi:hypothetical protein NE237_002456 [Protea cynaroides]|uniref:Uncharacterized protein n=1 Tax=Protea cynaroides TaxID=273540 RepID=A0A9Q0QZ21_9MAGN|nr:hypothetical protein NE237_002456 [Protea cynaroides]